MQGNLDLINFKYIYQRYLDLASGRNPTAPVKFNGQAFTVDVGQGPDYRGWGASYWWQNTRRKLLLFLIDARFLQGLILPLQSRTTTRW